MHHTECLCRVGGKGCRWMPRCGRGPLPLDRQRAASEIASRTRISPCQEPLCGHQMSWGLIFCGVSITFRSARRPERRHVTRALQPAGPRSPPGTSGLIEHRRRSGRARLLFGNARHSVYACITQSACAESEARAAAGCRAVAEALCRWTGSGRRAKAPRGRGSRHAMSRHQMGCGLIFCGVRITFRSPRRPERRHATRLLQPAGPRSPPGTSGLIEHRRRSGRARLLFGNARHSVHAYGVPVPSRRQGLPLDAALWPRPSAAGQAAGGERKRLADEDLHFFLFFFFFFLRVFSGTPRGGKPLKQAWSLSQAGHPELDALHLLLRPSLVEKPCLTISGSHSRGHATSNGHEEGRRPGPLLGPEGSGGIAVRTSTAGQLTALKLHHLGLQN